MGSKLKSGSGRSKNGVGDVRVEASRGWLSKSRVADVKVGVTDLEVEAGYLKVG